MGSEALTLAPFGPWNLLVPFGIPTVLSRFARRIGIPWMDARGLVPMEARYLLCAGLLALAGCARDAELPVWVQGFGYSRPSLHSVEIGTYGYPFIPVVIGGDTILLPFDTGNMAGLTVSSDLYARLNLPCSDEWDRLDSAGDVVSIGCTALGVRATLLGREYDSLRVLEFFHETLPGLVGPDLLPGSRFTMDYAAGLLACDSLLSPAKVPGFTAIPLVSSGRHPRLILVEGRVNGRPALIEIDTGKSRTTVDRTLVESMGLEETESGVPFGQVTLGPLAWSVESARVVDTSGISEGLPSRISVGIGSDLLRRFVVTVDYTRGMLWVEDPGVSGSSS